MFEILSLTLQEYIYLLDNKYYSQTDRDSMRSTLGPTLANIFLCYHESTWPKCYPIDLKPVYYKSYSHDIFVLFNKQNIRSVFLNIVMTKHKKIELIINR